MRFLYAALLILSATAAAAEEPAPKPVCTPPDEMVIKLPMARAVILNNILQDVDVVHREWREVANDVRAQLVSQCKETKK